MDQPKTLSQVIHSDRDGRSKANNVTNYNTYLNIFALNVSSRYPDISNLERIPYDEIRKVADFSVACTSVVVETWDRIWEERAA